LVLVLYVNIEKYPKINHKILTHKRAAKKYT